MFHPAITRWWRGFLGKKMAEKLDLQTITDARGNLTVLERLPFAVKRVYYLHGVDPNAMRGGHAQKGTDRVMVAVNGSFKVTVRSKGWSEHVLDDPKKALRVKPLEWLELTEFTPDAVCLVLASEEYDEADSVRDFETYTRLLKKRSQCDCLQGRLPCTCERSVQ
jgi:hypothetical protein